LGSSAEREAAVGRVEDRPSGVKFTRHGSSAGGLGGFPPDGIFDTAFSQDGNDRDKLVRFLRDLEKLLGFVARYPDGMVPKELHGDIAPAWRTVRPRFSPAVDALREIPDEDLEASGLTGPELEMKLGGVRWAYARFKAAFNSFPGTPVAKALSAVLGFSDVIADSIPVVGQALHPIREFKSYLEKGADVVDVVIE
jgi:hypothetical protein